MPTSLLGAAFSARPSRRGLGFAAFFSFLCLLIIPAVHAQSPTTVNDTDTGITYAGAGWGYSSGRGLGDFQNDVHYATTNGSAASYTFTGTGISVITELAADEGNVQISLDGALQATVNCYSATRKVQQAVWTKSGLPAGSHTLKLVKQDGTYLLLDALQVTTPDFSLSAAPATLSIPQGTGKTATVSLTNLNGFTGSALLAASGLPAGVTAAFAPASVSGTAPSTLHGGQRPRQSDERHGQRHGKRLGDERRAHRGDGGSRYSCVCDGDNDGAVGAGGR